MIFLVVLSGELREQLALGLHSSLLGPGGLPGDAPPRALDAGGVADYVLELVLDGLLLDLPDFHLVLHVAKSGGEAVELRRALQHRTEVVRVLLAEVDGAGIG